MDGITNIIEKIHEQTDIQNKALLDTAKADADEIIKKAENDAHEILVCAKQQIEKEISLVLEKAKSTAELEYKRIVLQGKSEALSDALAFSLEKTRNLPADKYFDGMLLLVSKHALKKCGEICLSEKNVSRLPSDFLEKANAALGGEYLTLSSRHIDDDGFVIQYPEVNIDCTFSCLTEDMQEEIMDEFNKILF